MPFGPGMERPALLSGPQPVYPREALAAKVEGMMLVKCVITTAGTLRSCRILKGLPYMERPVLDALAQYRYKPVVFQGRPINLEYVIPLKFKLQ
jgi:protein TonB